jgi:hypothetical protein
MWQYSIVQPNSIGSLIERDPTSVYVLGILYLISAGYAFRSFLSLTRWMRSPVAANDSIIWLDTPVLLAGSITFTIIVRSVSFIVTAVLMITDKPVAGSTDALSTVISVSFSTGDFETILTYLLLLLFYVDMLQRTHTHFFSPSRMRLNWLISYVVLLVLFLLAQIGLYVAVFTVPDVNKGQSILQLVFVVIGFLNLALPAALMIMWLVFTIMMAGFPFRSARSRRVWQRIRLLVGGWTSGRILWGIAAIFIANDGFINAVNAVGPWLFTTVIITLFVVAELLPFAFTISGDNLRLFAPGVVDMATTSNSDDANELIDNDGDAAGRLMEDEVDDAIDVLRLERKHSSSEHASAPLISVASFSSSSSSAFASGAGSAFPPRSPGGIAKERSNASTGSKRVQWRDHSSNSLTLQSSATAASAAGGFSINGGGAAIVFSSGSSALASEPAQSSSGHPSPALRSISSGSSGSHGSATRTPPLQSLAVASAPSPDAIQLNLSAVPSIPGVLPGDVSAVIVSASSSSSSSGGTAKGILVSPATKAARRALAVAAAAAEDEEANVARDSIDEIL